MENEKVVIVDVVRTPWGKPGGSLEKFISSDLAAAALKKLLARTGIAPSTVDQVVFGQAHPSTMPNNIGHYAWLKAELPVEVPGYTVQSNTASAMQAVRNAYYLIASGNEQVVIAGGADSYSAAPFVMRDVRNHFEPKNRVVIDSLDEGECCTQPVAMSRCEQYQKAHAAQESVEAKALASNSRQNANQFKIFCGDQMASVSYIDRKKGEIIVSEDEWILRGTDPKQPLAPYADGAAVTMLMSERKAASLGITPIGEILGFSVAGGNPVKRQETGAAAAKKLLMRQRLSIEDISVVEILENSAEDVRSTIEALDGAPTINPLGGALAYGLNDGAEGIAMIQRAIAFLKAGQLGLLCLYGAGGQGMAALIRKRGPVKEAYQKLI